MEWMLMPYRRYAEFSGRSRRKEYWMFYLLTVVVVVVGYALMLSGGAADLMIAAAADPANPVDPTGVSFGPLFWAGLILLLVWCLVSIVPSIAVTVRRLHDRNMSGWYLLGFIVAAIVVNMVPLVGQLLYLVMAVGWIVLLALPGTSGPNQYGPDPVGQADPKVFA
jgi:uncharacterized membrane protein YhaH (DUF805 family)